MKALSLPVCAGMVHYCERGLLLFAAKALVLLNAACVSSDAQSTIACLCDFILRIVNFFDHLSLSLGFST